MSLQPPKESTMPFLGFRKETATVVTFRFGLRDERFQHQPGQYATVFLPGLLDPRGPVRQFSISSSPTETGFISVTTRLRGSPFKEHLLSRREGEEVRVRGPFGRFLRDEERPAVMLAGGIGITPFRSMIRYAVDRELEQPIVLLYSNHVAEEIVFREELEQLSQRSEILRVVITVTRPDESKVSWNGRTGRIDAGLVREVTAQLSSPVFYACGPPLMVDDLSRILLEVGVARNDVRQEKFEGY